MKVLIAPDSFKDSLTASQVAKAMEKGVRHFSAASQCFRLSASDGGEGFLRAVNNYVPGLEVISMMTEDPLGRPIKADYLWDKNSKSAYIELAQASGLELLSNTERNPLFTSTYGTGLQIKHAIAKGAKSIYVGIGGSSTNDGGIGIAQALGFSFFSEDDTIIKPVGSQLSIIYKIRKPGKKLKDYSFYAINDVLNPLYGKDGAAYTYGKQKGASKEEIELLDIGLQNLETAIKSNLKIDEAHTAGSGAAGGTAYGLKCFLGATYISGTSFMLNLARFKELIKQEEIDVIITGEGRIDTQTAHGKFVFGLAREANALGIPVLGLCGKLELTNSQVREIGLSGAAQLYDPLKPVAYSYENAEALVTQRTYELLKNFYS